MHRALVMASRKRLALVPWLGTVLMASGLSLATHAFAQVPGLTAEDIECGTMKHPKAPEPRDFRYAAKDYIRVVEVAHFASNVENLVRPMFEHFGSDISYTLHALPNHHRALVTLGRLSEREKTDTPTGMPYNVDCFFRRGLRFAPDDLIVRMLYAQYLAKKARKDVAIMQLDFVRQRAGDNPFTHYNLGLLYFDMGSFDQALEQAHKAAELGMPRQELKDKLQRAGRWREPDTATSSPERAASAPQ